MPVKPPANLCQRQLLTQHLLQRCTIHAPYCLPSVGRKDGNMCSQAARLGAGPYSAGPATAIAATCGPPAPTPPKPAPEPGRTGA
jgi:hypothetical protein